MNPKDEYEVIEPGSPMKSVKAHENTKLVKGPRKPKANKWAKDAQRKKGHKSP